MTSENRYAFYAEMAEDLEALRQKLERKLEKLNPADRREWSKDRNLGQLRFALRTGLEAAEKAAEWKRDPREAAMGR
jgi:hypothetical protein